MAVKVKRGGKRKGFNVRVPRKNTSNSNVLRPRTPRTRSSKI